ncbi:MAG: isopentenyl-diphosphate Delta-isomerase [Cytophagales bacterium]
MEERVVIVDENDNNLGTEEKLEAHKKGLLHRAFSIFIFNEKKQLLIHKRNSQKYHSGGLWTNTCCGHPRPNEAVEKAAFRRLYEEMGFSCTLEKQFDFIYKADFDNGLTEHELDHVFTGQFSNDPNPNPVEVEDWRFVDWDWLLKDVNLHPKKYTVWFKICLDKFNKTVISSLKIQ